MNLASGKVAKAETIRLTGHVVRKSDNNPAKLVFTRDKNIWSSACKVDGSGAKCGTRPRMGDCSHEPIVVTKNCCFNFNKIVMKR